MAHHRHGRFRSNELPMLSTDLVQDNVPATVAENIFVGSIHAAFNQEAIHERGITHVLNASGIPGTFPRRFTYLTVDIRDKEDANLLSAIAVTNMFIESGVEKGGVLVHCLGGHSRSPAFIIAYLMSSSGYSYDDAYAILRLARPVASINTGFEYQLRAYNATGCDAYAAHQLILRLRLAAIQPSPLASQASNGTNQMEESRIGGGKGGGAIKQQQQQQQHGKVNSSDRIMPLSSKCDGSIGQYLPLKSASVRLRFSSPIGPSMQVMSPLSSLETIFDCKACGTLLFAGTSILSTEISLPDVSTVFNPKATPTFSGLKETASIPHLDLRGGTTVDLDTPVLGDNQSECSSIDATLVSQGVMSPTAPLVNTTHKWESGDFEGQRMWSSHRGSTLRPWKSFVSTSCNFQDAESVQSPMHSITSANSCSMDWEPAASLTSISTPLKLEYSVTSDQPPVGIPYLKLMVGMTVGSNSPTHMHPSTPNNQKCGATPLSVSGRNSCPASPSVSEVSSSAVSVVSQHRPPSAEKRRWLARMALEGHGASTTSPRKELDLLHLLTQDGKWILVEPLEWMGDIKGDSCGKIYCPNPACRCVLGEWSWLPGKLGPPCIAPPTIGLLETAIRMTRTTLSQKNMSPSPVTLHGMRVRELYRGILRHARAFPSIKRDEMVEEIRNEFRENASLKDPDVVKEKVNLAIKGLQQLSAYTSLDQQGTSDWVINTEQKPWG